MTEISSIRGEPMNFHNVICKSYETQADILLLEDF